MTTQVFNNSRGSLKTISLSRFSLFVSTGVLLSTICVPLFGRSAKITIKGDGVRVQVSNGEGDRVTVTNDNNGETSSGKIGDDGTFTTDGVTGNPGDDYSITVGGEHFTGVMCSQRCLGEQDLKSKEEENQHSSLDLHDFHGSAFAFAGSYALFDKGIEGTPFNQFDFVNSSSSAYLVTSLQLYQGLEGSYFNTSEFDSAAAIATGSLYRDVTADLGSFEIGAGEQRLFSENISLGSHQYDLMAGFLRQIQPDGSLGPSEWFAIGSQPAPEPSSLLLMGSGILGLSELLRKRLLTRR